MMPTLAVTLTHRARFVWLTGALAATAFAFIASRPRRVEIRQPLDKIGHCVERHARLAPAPLDDVRPPVAADLVAYTKDMPPDDGIVATIDTNLGALHCDLYVHQAPIAVANFIGLATGQKPWKNPETGATERGKPFYDGLTLHRVIPGFVIQGGDPRGNGTGGPGYTFENEISADLHFSPGMLAMANKGDVASNGSQFFITEGSPGWLDGRHTIFGRCHEVDLVENLARVPSYLDRPNQPLTIDHITFAAPKPIDD
ncbi:MAG: Peptidylprolyl isomerase [Myxococcales bacterium]|nr:Peptidylprolyl isomerase [Myxococcales bacterium]